MISVYLLLDLCLSPCPFPSPSPCPFPSPCPCLSPSPSPSPCLCLFLPPAQTPAPPQTPARPRLPSVPVPDLPGDGNGRRCRPGVRRGTVGRRIVAEVFPGRAEIHHRAPDSGRSVPRACGAAPLGYGNERKCCPGVLRGTVGRRNGAEVFPECAPRHRWATELDVSAARACVVVLLGDGTGQKCRPSVW